MVKIYTFLCVIGTILPYSVFIMWIREYGLDVQLFISNIITSKIALFAWFDVIVSSLVLIAFIWNTGPRDGVRYSWIAILGTLTIGVSFGLPFYLLLREIYVDNKKGVLH